MSIKTRIAKLESVKPEKVLPSYAVRQSDGYLLCYADGHKERVNELPARVKCYSAEASPLGWDGEAWERSHNTLADALGCTRAEVDKALEDISHDK